MKNYMKKTMGFSVPALVIASLLISAGTNAQALTNTANTQDSAKVQTDATLQKEVNANTKTKIETDGSIKADADRSRQLQTNTPPKSSDSNQSKIDFWAQFEVRDLYKGIVENVTKNFSNARTVLEAAHDRISKLADRIESRLNKLSAEGDDVSTQLKLVAAARAELRLAKISTEASKTSFATELVTFSSGADVQYFKVLYERCKAEGYPIMETAPGRCKAPNGVTYVDADSAPRVGKGLTRPFAKTIANIEEAKTHLKNAHELLVKAISSLKPGLQNSTTKVNPLTDPVRVKSSTNVEVNPVPAAN